MASVDVRTLPPGAEILVSEMAITRANMCGNYIAFPFYWNTTGFNLALNGDYSADNGATYGRASTMELMDTWKCCSQMRSFYPTATMLYSQTLGIGGTTMGNFLRLLDFWNSKTNDDGNPLTINWVMALYSGQGASQAIWAGYSQDAAAGEQAIVDYLEAIFGSYASTSANNVATGAQTFTVATNLLPTSANFVKIYQTSNPANYIFASVTSYNSGTGALVVNGLSVGGSGSGVTDWSIKYCSPNGYTLAEHPALATVEISNEQIKNTSVGPAFARAARIVTKLLALYKPAVSIILGSCANGSQYFKTVLAASAVSLYAHATNGDDGTGKQASDYAGSAIAYHPYQATAFNTAAGHDAAIANNAYISNTILGSAGVVFGALEMLCKYTPTSNLYIGSVDPNTIPVHITETGCIGLVTNVNSGGWAWFMSSQADRFANLLRWAVTQMFFTRDGAGKLGKYFYYAFDGSGNSGGVTGKNGTLGTISKATAAAHTSGEVKLTLSAATDIAFSATILNQTIVITAGSGGWADLGLSANQKKRFVMSSAGSGQVYIQGTTYTGQPSTDAAYTEFQLDWSPYREELKQVNDLLLSGLVTLFLVRYSGGGYAGMGIHVKGVGTWYFKSNGTMSTW